MKRSILLLCVFVCCLLISPPFASAACIGSVTPFPTPTTSPPGPYGTIYVESSPAGANIYLDDEYRGHAPLTITGLWPKSYEITAKMTGYETFTSVTTISGPTRASVYCPLTPDNSASGLVVTSSPGKATVYIDGIEKGVTPRTVSDLATGSHTIQLTLAGYDDWKSSVDYHTGTPKTVSATLKKKTINTDQGINISSSPGGASVTFDGLGKGNTPLTLNDLAAGIHILQLEYPGYLPWKSTIDVPETGIKDIRVTLGPEPASVPGWITVSSIPAGASVTLDGNYVGLTPVNGTLNLDAVAAGEHTISLNRSGYLPYSTRTNVSPNAVSAVSAVLVPVSVNGVLSVTSDPAGAEIFIDNKSTGISPLTVNDIAQGNHRITLRLDGYEEYTTSFFVIAGTNSSVSATLQPVTTPLQSPVNPLTVLGALAIIGFLAVRRRR
jgi:PEGA domain